MSHPRNDTGPTEGYVLGHSQRELDRLMAQARLIDPITRQFFQEAAIVPGMRVLDVGSGAGDVAFLAADLVGATGEVVGVDRSPAAVGAARTRAAARSLPNVSFLEGDPTTMAFERPFDAVIGRYVLAFQADPTAMLCKLAEHVRPGGVIVFHELDWDGVQSFPPVPTYDRCCRWIVETMSLSGGDKRMGMKLHATFVAAGLAAPSMRLHSILGGGANGSEPVQLITGLASTLVAAMERSGVATAADVGIDTLAQRVCDEMIATGSVIVGRAEIGAWSRVERTGAA